MNLSIINQLAKPAANTPSSSMAGTVPDPIEQAAVKEGFEFIDFVPDIDVSHKAEEKLSRLSGEAPSDSSLFASLRKTFKGFEGRLHIRSSVGHFMAEVVGEDPLQVLNSLSRKVRSQLRLWKSQRFLKAPVH